MTIKKIKLGRSKITDGTKKVQMPIYPEEKKIKKLGRAKCRKIAESAIDKAYEAAM